MYYPGDAFNPSYAHHDSYADGYKECRFDIIRMLLKTAFDASYLAAKLPGFITVHTNSIHAIGNNNIVDIFQFTNQTAAGFKAHISNFQHGIDKIDLSSFNGTYKNISFTTEGSTQITLDENTTLIIDRKYSLGVYDFILS